MGAHNSTVPNFAMVSGSDFYGGTASGPGGLHDGLWCQSAIKNASDEVGSWLYPNGTGVLAESDARPVSMEHSPGQVGLVRKATLIGNEGFYTCIIPDEDGVNRTLVVWAAGVATYEGNAQKRECGLELSIARIDKFSPSTQALLYLSRTIGDL